MNNNQHKDFDKFFQDKMNDRQFEYQDDFWAEMETLLPEENTDTTTAGNIRRRLIWGTLLLLLIGFTGWLSYPYAANSNEKQVSTISEKENSKTVNSEQLSNELLINNDLKEETIEETNEVIINKTTDNQLINQAADNIGFIKYDRIKKENNLNIFSKKGLNQPNQLLNNKEGMSFPADIFNNSDNNSDNNSTKETNLKAEGDKPLAIVSDIDKEKIINSNQVGENVELVNPFEKNRVENNQISDFSYLKTLSLNKVFDEATNEISKVEPTCDGCPQLPNLQSIKVGLIAGFSASQGWKNTQSNRANPSLDPTIGLRLEYKTNPIADWTYGTELYYWSRSSLNAQYGYDSTSYGFGITTVSRKINIEELHNIALPIYAIYSKEKHQFIGGVNVNYIINAQSTTTGNGHFYSANNVELFNVATTQQWGYTSAFNRFDVGLMLGYDYEVKEGWRLGTRINYGFTDIAKNNIFNNNTFDNNLNIRLLLTCDLLEFKF